MLGLDDILRRIDVEKWIYRLGSPVRDGDAMTGGPDFDLAQAFRDKGLP